MTHSRVFNESVFHSWTDLKSFFDQSDAAEQVLSHRNEVFSTSLNPLNPKLAGIWQVCQIATAPFRWIAAIALKIISGIAARLGAVGCSEQLSLTSKQLIIGFNIYSQNDTHLFQIADSINQPNREGEKVNNSSEIPCSRITDPKVQCRTFGHSQGRPVRFDHQEGICRGESYWFLHLYLKTKSQFSDPRSHMAALGAQFAKGGGMEPTLLQSLYIKKGKLLGLKIGTQPEHSRGVLATPLIQKTPREWKNSPEEMSLQLQNLPVGAYTTGFPRHRTAFVKISPTLSYFFDPNEGIREINGPEQGKLLYQIMSETLEGTGGGSFGNLDMIPVILRS